MSQLPDLRTVVKAGLISLALIFIMGIFDLYDFGGPAPVNDFIKDAPEKFKGELVSDSEKIISYIFSWIAITLAVTGFLYFSSERKRKKKFS